MPRFLQLAVVRAREPSVRASPVVANEGVGVPGDIQLKGQRGVSLVKPFERARNVLLADVSVRSLRACDEVALHSQSCRP